MNDLVEFAKNNGLTIYEAKNCLKSVKINVNQNNQFLQSRRRKTKSK